MTFIRSVFLFTFASLAFAEVEFPCPDGWEKFQGSCYRVTSTGGTFEDSRDICLRDDGDLVAITSEAENDFVKDLVRRVAGDAVTSAWIGVKQDGPVSWKLVRYGPYETQRPRYTDWAGHSSEKCVALSKEHDWRWTQEDCDAKMSSRAFVCRRYPPQKACYDGSCYELVDFEGSGDLPKTWCEMRGGYVVEINSKEEQTFVEEILNKATLVKPDVFLGASDEDEEGTFVWKHGGTPLEYSNWATDQPDDDVRWGSDCSMLSKELGWQWKDVDCLFTPGSVLCEIPKESGLTG